MFAARHRAEKYAARSSVAGKHHLRRPGHDRAEAPDWMLGLLQRDAHGLHLPGIASGTLLGTSGAAVLIFYGISIALLFALTGEIHREQARLCSKISAASATNAARRFYFGLAAFASISLPAFANFTGEVMVLFGTFRNGANPNASAFIRSHRPRPWGVVDIGGLHAAGVPRRVHGLDG